MRTEAVGGLQSVQDGQYREAASNFLNGANLSLELMKSSIPDPWPQSSNRNPALFYRLRGRAYSLNRSYEEAMGAYKKALELEPVNGANYSNVASIHIDLKQYDDALVAAKKGVELAADAPFSYQVLGNAYGALKHYDEAIDAYRKVAELTPNDAHAFDQLASLHARTGNFAEAVASLDKAIGLVTFVGIGVGDRSVDGEPVLQAVEAGPAADAGLMTGDTLVKIDGQPTKGRDDNWLTRSLRGAENTRVVVTVRRQGETKPFDRTITRRLIVPKTAAVLYGKRGLCLREIGNQKGAINDAELAYSLDPENLSAREALAAIDLDRGKYDEALKILSLLKENPLARLLEATAYARQSDVNRAVALYGTIPQDRILAAPLTQHAANSLKQDLRSYVQARLDKARAAESAGQFVEALAEYSEAVKVADDATAGASRQRVATLLKGHPYLAELPEEARKSALHGELYIKDGRFEEALTEYRAALGVAPFNAKLHADAALICGQLKDYRQAIVYMTIYLQLSPDAPDARAAKDEIYRWEFALGKGAKR